MTKESFTTALVYAAEAHATQFRKGTGIPYIAHLLAVASTVMEYGGDQDEAIAALLHDSAEDQGGEARIRDIEERFGSRVAVIVRDCSDSLTTDPSAKEPWKVRKERYIEEFRHHSTESLLVSLSDKVSNGRSIIRDLRDPAIGSGLWARFKPGKDGTLWYYRELAKAFIAIFEERGLKDNRVFQLALELEELAGAMETAGEHRLTDDVPQTSR